MVTAPYISADDAPAKKRILSSALKLFVECGLCETTVRDIAVHAKCSNPALFKHFKNKKAFALFLFEHCYLWLFQIVSGAMAAHGKYQKRQRVPIETYTEAIQQDSAAVLFAQENLRYFWPAVHPAVRRHSILALIHQMLKECQREGSVTTEVELEMLAMRG